MACTPQRAAEIGELCGGRLAAGPASELLLHLEGCPACSRELDLVADLLRVPERAWRPAAASPGRRWRLALAVAAAALLVLLPFLWPGRDRERELSSLARLSPPPAAGLVLRGAPEGERSPRQEALELFSAGEHLRAAELLAELARAEPLDPWIQLYLGLARLQLAADADALEPLARAAELGDDLLAETALWYLAQAHLARAEGPAAQAVLRRLIERDGDYEPNARALLAELEPLLAR